MLQVKRAGHSTLTTPDVERMIDYFTRIVGLSLVAREKKRAILATKSGPEAIVLERGVTDASATKDAPCAPPGASYAASKSRTFMPCCCDSHTGSAGSRTAVRRRPMVAAAWMPWPVTSPTTRPTRLPDMAITSNQSPPTVRPDWPGR